jgi:hypothetical protein
MAGPSKTTNMKFTKEISQKYVQVTKDKLQVLSAILHPFQYNLNFGIT